VSAVVDSDLAPTGVMDGWLAMPPSVAGGFIPSTPLRKGPVWFSGPTRCHRTRYGHLHQPIGKLPLRRSYGMWCGQSRFTGAVDWRPGMPLCGTCEGRAVGAGYPTSAQLTSGDPVKWPDLTFAPRDPWARPAVCPGSAHALVGRQITGRVYICAACQLPVSTRAAGSPYTPRLSVETHEPGPELIAACRHHAWERLTVGPDGVAVCGRCTPLGGP
jgi:hypothetical protein